LAPIVGKGGTAFDDMIIGSAAFDLILANPGDASDTMR
jgi:hypothetical protein